MRVECAKSDETAFARLRGQPFAEIVRVDARNLDETAFLRLRGQLFAEIVRVGCAKSGRNCVCAFAQSTLCADVSDA